MKHPLSALRRKSAAIFALLFLCGLLAGPFVPPAISAEPALDYSDMWWAGPGENGWGMSVTQHGALQFIALYVYDDAGKPVWYVLPNGTWNASLTAYTGALYKPVSSPYSAYDPARFKANDPVGTLTVTYTGGSTATLAYEINGVAGTKSLSRQMFGAGAKLPLQVNDLWWNPAENGWGMNIAQQGSMLFPVWYTYDANGNTTWFVVPGGSWNATTFTGDMYAVAGSAWLGAAYNPAALAIRRVGAMTLAFSGTSRATMTYTVDGLTQQKSIERQFPQTTPPIDVALTGMAVIKVRADTQGATTMEEKLTSIFEIGPNRRISVLDDSSALTGRYAAPDGWSIVDFARHPSGETTAVLATAKTVKLVRLDRFAAAIAEFPLIDPQAPNDPFYDSGGLHDDTSMVPVYTRDAVRLAAIGENVAVALRTGRNAVVAYRFDYGTVAGYTRAWRTLVEPGLTIGAIGIFVGSYDVFGALENHWHVLLDADAAGNVVVAVIDRPFFSDIFQVHADFFAEPLSATAGVLVTRLAPDGRRLGSTPVDTVRTAEAYALRLNGEDIAIVGRVFSEQRGDGGGWNAYAAHVARSSGALSSYRLVDIDLGEVLFDIAPLPGGRFLVAGAAGYTQNPTGASISEEMTPLLAVLEADGTVRQRIDVPAGARQNQLRSLAARGADWLVGGIANGPGTHSGDGNPAAISADGFVRELGLTIP